MYAVPCRQDPQGRAHRHPSGGCGLSDLPHSGDCAEEPTKVTWDWSKAADAGRADDHYSYLKIRANSPTNQTSPPSYLWFNGNNEYRYLLGDKINPMVPPTSTNRRQHQRRQGEDLPVQTAQGQAAL